MGAFALFLGLAAHAALPTIVDLAVATPDLSTLVAALKAGGLVGTLSGPGPFTVFAPTNEAFAALPPGVLAGLLKPENKAQLVDILTYHVVSGDVHAKDLTDGEVIKTIEGKTVTAHVSSAGVFINDAQVTTANVDASNGVVHIINKVLLPPAPAPTPAAGSVVEYQCTQECGTCSVGTTWEENKCLTVGNAPPYPNSQIVTVKDGKAIFTAYKGDSCQGAPTQVNNNPLNQCKYFVGTLWTVFRENNATSLQ